MFHFIARFARYPAMRMILLLLLSRNPAVLAFVPTSSQLLPKMPKEMEELDEYAHHKEIQIKQPNEVLN